MAKARAAAVTVIAGCIAAALAWHFRARPPPLSVLGRGTQACQLERRFGVKDVLEPDRPVFTLEPSDPAFAGVAARPSEDRAWVRARPDPKLRYERTVEERGGVDPCALPAPKAARFGAWKFLTARSYLALSQRPPVRDDGGFDTVLIFHGHDVALTQWAQADVAMVLFGTTRQDYRTEYAGPEALGQLLLAIESRVSEEVGRPAHARRVGLAAWSGGYDAISTLLEHSRDRARVDAVMLLDGLHCSRDPEVMPKQLAPFVSFARRAAEGQTFMVVTHSSVDTDGFASTTETMHFLASELGGRPLRVQREDPLGLSLHELFDRGGFHLRGHAGGGKRDHCAHLGLYPVVARALGRRWESKGG